MQQGDESLPLTLTRMVRAYELSQVIHVVAKLGIADRLLEGARASDDLAAEAGVHPGALYRLLRAAAAGGILHEDDERRFSLTPLGDLLRRDAVGSVAGIAEFFGNEPLWRAWGGLLDSVRNGDNAFERIFGTDPWRYRAQHPEENDAFNRAMTGMSHTTAAAVIAAYDFTPYRCVVDVGGGHGAMLAQILQAAPESRGILFDQPHVVTAATALDEAGVRDRCEVVGGSFFESVPPGGDAYILRSVLHDWADEHCIAILSACRRAMSAAARVIVLERLIGRPNEALDNKLSDLNMLVSPGGQERTAEEFDALFAAAGLRLAAVTPTASTTNVIEAVPIA
ncbi:MAG TPA: methyltransferase [Dehalococcoidia bacterium]